MENIQKFRDPDNRDLIHIDIETDECFKVSTWLSALSMMDSMNTMVTVVEDNYGLGANHVGYRITASVNWGNPGFALNVALSDGMEIDE